MRRITPVLAVFGVCLSAAAFARSQNSIFTRLTDLEQHEAASARTAERCDGDIAKLDERIDSLAQQMKVANRAASPIRRQVAQSMRVWVSSLSSHGGTTWQKRDTSYLLGHAAAKALRPKLSNVALLDLAQSHQATLQFTVAERARLSVQLAQAKADVNVTRENRARVLQDAKNDESVRQDLAHTDEALHSSLTRLLKNKTQVDFHRFKGTLLPPVPGEPDVKFGPRATNFKDVTIRHTGLTWKIESGTPVKVVGAGLVVFAHAFEGYGNLVIVDHGGGYHSLYAHLGALNVSAGDQVEKARVIGKSGETGSLEGPKFYFELRQNGLAVDPQEWFIRK